MKHNLIIHTGTGALQGELKDGYCRYKGIPYAKAERFLPPEKYSWEGLLECAAFGKKAMQVYDNNEPWAKKTKP